MDPKHRDRVAFLRVCSGVLKDRWDRSVLLFKNQWNLEQVMSEHSELELSPIAIPPITERG
jgi:peptide chain release factor 3